MNSKLRKAFGVVAGAAAFTMSMAGTAFALSTFSGEDGSCDSGDVCMWKDDAGAGYYFTTPSANSDYRNRRWYSHDSSPHDEVDSIRNRWTVDIGVWTDVGYGGTQWCFPSGMNYIHTLGSSNDNIHDSHKTSTFNC